jgi:cytoskeletal protein CcmA (bactofilin family)/ribosomal protein S27E
MFGGIRKVPTECPHCGHVQHEPVGLISTYCRGCGDHYAVRRQSTPVATRSRPSSQHARKKDVSSETLRVACHECGHEHKAAPHAENTACPACGTTISFHDIEILGHSTRIIQTRGSIHVGREGFLNSTRIVCGNAFVEGRIAGKVTCEGTLRLRGSGICRAQITAKTLIIDRVAALRFPSMLRVGEIVIRGRVEADVECVGTLHIGRYGALEGDIRARSMIVDKGGSYAGDVQVATTIQRPAEEPREERGPRVSPAWRTELAFG